MALSVENCKILHLRSFSSARELAAVWCLPLRLVLTSDNKWFARGIRKTNYLCKNKYYLQGTRVMIESRYSLVSCVARDV